MAAAKKQNTKLQDWIRKHGGVNRVADLIGVPRITLYTWYDRRRMPSAENAKLLMDFSKGELTIDDIIEGTKA